jgi:hypothetical protein
VDEDWRKAGEGEREREGGTPRRRIVVASLSIVTIVIAFVVAFVMSCRGVTNTPLFRVVV